MWRKMAACLIAVLMLSLSLATVVFAEELTETFDTLDKWERMTGNWQVSDGKLAIGPNDDGKIFLKDKTYKNFEAEFEVQATRANSGFAFRVVDAGIPQGCDYKGLFLGYAPSDGIIILGALGDGWKELVRGDLTGIDSSKAHTIKVIAQDDNIQVFMDDNKQALINYTITDPTIQFGRGKIGFRAYQREAWADLVEFDNLKITSLDSGDEDEVTPTEPNTVPEEIKPINVDLKQIYKDDFSKDSSIQYKLFGGDWTVEKGRMIFSENYAGMALLGDKTWSDYAAEITVLGKKCNAGIAFRVTQPTASGPDMCKGYYAGIDGVNRGVALGRMDYGWNSMEWYPLPDDYDVNKPHVLKVVAIGEQIQISLDGKVIISVVDNSNPTGYVGFRAMQTGSWQGAVSFDDFKVYDSGNGYTVEVKDFGEDTEATTDSENSGDSDSEEENPSNMNGVVIPAIIIVVVATLVAVVLIAKKKKSK